MGIIPPDPGAVVRDPSRAIALAKITEHDKMTGGFRRSRGSGEVRWLRRDGDRLVACASGELRVGAETHAILRLARGEATDAGVFDSEHLGARGLHVLVEDGFEARAVPA